LDPLRNLWLQKYEGHGHSNEVKLNLGMPTCDVANYFIEDDITDLSFNKNLGESDRAMKASPAAKRKKKVLLVEDNKMNQAIAVVLLKKLELEVPNILSICFF